jgi:calcium binding protein 39
MSFLFSRSKQKSPSELVRSLNEAIQRVERQGDRKKAIEEMQRWIFQIKSILYGDEENDPQIDLIALLAQEVYTSDVLVGVVNNLHQIDFDSRKDVVVIFTTLLRRKIGNRSPTVDYLVSRPNIFETLILHNGNQDTCLSADAIVRDCAKYESLTKLILSLSVFWNYFDYIHTAPFEMAAGAFATLNDILMTQEQVTAEFLRNNGVMFNQRASELMRSDNYVTKRQSLKLVAQLLRHRANFNFMTMYIDDVDNLKLVMNLLKDKSKNIQNEAFHIFKIFVANPKKSKPILDILIKNKVRLLKFLSDFSTERSNDKEFEDEKSYIINNISALPDLVPSSSVPSTANPSRDTSPTPGIHGPITQLHTEAIVRAQFYDQQDPQLQRAYVSHP